MSSLDRNVVAVLVAIASRVAFAQPAAPVEPPAPTSEAPPAPIPAPDAAPPPPPTAATLSLHDIAIHGFASEGGFLSTANDYIGASSRGSVELFEAGLNVSTEVADRLRVGLQLYGRDVGVFRDLRLDWAFLDYHWREWLGLRAGVIKMPFGLYNEYEDIDASRLAILLPQSVYSIRNRSALLAQTGFAAYGVLPLRGAGELEYQGWLGTLQIPENALIIQGGRIDRIDTKYVTGVQVFWRPPIDGLKVGASFLRTSVDFHVTLDPASVAALIMAGLVPNDFTGRLVVSQRPASAWVASAEYILDDWLFAAEYSRFDTRQRSTLPSLLPTTETVSERFYAMVTRRLTPHVETGGYYSVLFADADDRAGDDMMKFPKSYYAFQRDLAATVRFDVNDHWLWKLEAHFIDGAADIDPTLNTTAERYWGLFLLKTTVTF